MKRIKPWLLLLLVFCAGVAGGIVVTRVAVRRYAQHVIKDPDFLRQRVENRIVTKLRLDAAQRAKAHEALIETQHQLDDLRKEFQPRFQAIMLHAELEIAGTLTPEQHRHFAKLQAEDRTWWQPK